MNEWQGNKTVFKTYFHGKADTKSGKGIPDEPIKDSPGHTWEEVKDDEYFGAVLNDGFVDISFDTKILSDIFCNMANDFEWKCIILSNTENGHIHSYWRKSNDWNYSDGKDKKLAAGLTADIHSGSTYIRLKDGESKRFPPIRESDTIQEVPKILTPLEKCDIDFMKLGEGERNSTLFSYILSLQRAGLDRNDIREAIKAINSYVLPEPLDDKEVETILRDEAFKKEVFFQNKRFQHDKFAQYLLSQYHIKEIDGRLHIYDNGIYISEYRMIERAMIKEIPGLTDRQRKEVIKQLALIAPSVSRQTDFNHIVFRNGVYDIDTDTLGEFNPSLIVTNKIPWDYNPYAKSELVDKVLDRLSCGDIETRHLIEEIAGACMYRSATLGGGKAAILAGDKANGKSTLLDMIRTMLGEGNYSSLDIKQIATEKYSIAMLYDKLANLGDDIASLDIKDASVIKKLITGEELKAEMKGQDPFEFVPYATHIYSVNRMPRINDPTGALLRRLIFVPLNAHFTKEDTDYNPNIRYELRQVQHMEYFIQCALYGLADVISNNGFTEPNKSKQAKADYEKENNPIMAFVDDFGEENIVNNSKNDVFKSYQVFCNDNNFQCESKQLFSRSIKKLLEIEDKQIWINGKNVRLYVKTSK